MHLSDEQLHEYLDQALAPEKRAEAVRHLAACADCTARLSSLQTLFAEIESLPDAAPAHDLAAPVVRSLRPAPGRWLSAGASAPPTETGRAVLPRWVRLTAGLQAAMAVLGLIFAAPILTELVSPWLPAYDLPPSTTLLVELQSQWTAWLQGVEAFTLPSISVPTLDLSGLGFTLTAVVVFLVWVAGNRLLLRRVA